MNRVNIKRWRSSAAALIALLGLISCALISGCEPGDISAQPGDAGTQSPKPTPGTPPVYIIPPIPAATAPGLLFEENDKAVIDFSNTKDGYVMARFRADTDMQVRVIVVIPDETEYTYRLAPGGGYETLPLSGGDGPYLIKVMEQVEGSRYATILATHVDVTLTDEFEPFLRPSQFVNFNVNSEVVRKAAELTAAADSLMDKIRVVYEFVITNIDYDYDLATSVQSGYIPVLDEVLERGKGICFDYAAVMTAMLRSQGIPTKMVFGFAGEAYHAWISVYSEETGWIDEVIFFDGVTWRLVDPTFAATGDAASVAQFIGDGTRYRVKYLY